MRPFERNMAERCRAQFPGLSRQIDGRPVVCFDGPAGTQVPSRVADAVRHCLLHVNANKGGDFETSREVGALMNRALTGFADFLGAPDPREIVFGPNMTTLTFHLARALAREWGPGDQLLVTATDHDANIAPWLLAARESGAEIGIVPFAGDTGLVDLKAFRSMLSPRTRLVAVACACNATGGINPFPEMVRLAHAVGAEVFLDAVHYAPHGVVDVQAWDCDWLGCSAYKFFGPHVGILWGRAERLRQLEPARVRPSSDAIPWRWMTGTSCFETIAGALEAVEYLADIGRDLAGDSSLGRRPALVCALEAIAGYESQLGWQLIRGLQEIPGVRIYGITDPRLADHRVPTVAFTVDGLSTAWIGAELGRLGFCVWTGNYYAVEFTTRSRLEPEGMVRVGLMHYNLAEEIDRFVKTVGELARTGMVVAG